MADGYFPDNFNSGYKSNLIETGNSTPAVIAPPRVTPVTYSGGGTFTQANPNAQGWGDGLSGFASNLTDSMTLGLTDFSNQNDLTTYQKYQAGTEASLGDIANISALNTANQNIVNKENSFMGRNADLFGGISTGVQTLGSIANIYSGFKQLGFMEDQVDIAKDTWAESKKELQFLQGARAKNNANY